ncbi:MAG: purine-nucleoside phosphorylase [Bacteriovoracaceae bacterium]|nr:purine-nucleoside phosphorylase [Bacteriovoracaceae bacterium]
MMKKLDEAAKYIQKRYPHQILAGVVLGSALGDFAKEIENPTVIDYADIPHFSQTTVEGHEGHLVCGTINKKHVACFQGRVHLYEGQPIENVVFPVRTLARLNCKYALLTNASGGINANYRPGDLVVIKDHINLTGRNPLVGPNLSDLGVRFPDMTDTYNKELRSIIEKSYKNVGIPYKTGIYCSVLGPSYETPAEIQMLKAIGGDLVGMSTVPEVIAAHHAGLKVAGIACVTNLAAGISLEHLNHEDVKKVAIAAKEKFSLLLKDVVKNLVA